VNGLLLIVVIAGERVALPADAVEAVVEIEALTPVPGAPPHVAGLSALRSRVVTVIDTRAALELSPSGAVARDAVLAVVDGHAYALLVDAVEDVLETAAESGKVPARLGAGWSRAASGCIDAEGDLLMLIDITALVAGPPVAEQAA
jgi:purine-binding chemotaxis protein CheW